MKEATKLLIETGIIPESVVRLCQIWGGEIGEPPGESAKQKTQVELLEVVKRVAELLEADALPELKETEPGLDALFAKPLHELTKAIVATTGASGLEADIKAFVAFTPTKKMVIRVGKGTFERAYAERMAQVGNRVQLIVGRIGRYVTITHVEPRYTNDVLSFYVCDVKEDEVA